MRTIYHNDHAITALAQNIGYTATSGGPFWQSGLKVTPNTTNTQDITVDVEPGTINIGTQNQAGETVRKNVSIQGQSVKLSPVADNPDHENGRVDVIYATPNGVDAIEGVEAVQRPTKAAPFNDDVEGEWPSLWSPAPDDGGLVPGVGRAVVFLTPDVSDSTDISDHNIINFDAQGVAQDFIPRDGLRTAIENITYSELPIETSVTHARQLDIGAEEGVGISASDLAQQFGTVTVPSDAQALYGTNNPDGPSKYTVHMQFPDQYYLQLYRFSASAASTPMPNSATASVVWRRGFGPETLYENTTMSFEENADGSHIAAQAANEDSQLTFQIETNLDSGATSPVSATFRYRLRDVS